MEKLPALEGNPRVHLIGHLQTNKVKQVIGKTTLIHSVDSLKLAKEISRQSLAAELVSDVLLQVNIGRDENKFGFLAEELPEALARNLAFDRNSGAWADDSAADRTGFRQNKSTFSKFIQSFY